jgi:hypothetical protein
VSIFMAEDGGSMSSETLVSSRLKMEVVCSSETLVFLRLKMEAVCSSETSVHTNKSTRRYNPEDQHRQVMGDVKDVQISDTS